VKILDYQINISDNGTVSSQLTENSRITPSETSYLDITPLALLANDYIPLLASEDTHPRDRLERIGVLLYQMLFPPPIAGHFLELAWRKIVQAPDRYRLALSINFDSRYRADVISLPWELLYLPRGKTFLSTDARVSLSRRSLDWMQLTEKRQLSEKLNILLVRLQPQTLESVALYPIKNYLDELSHETNLIYPPSILENPSPSLIEETLATLRPDIVHLLLHGDFSDRMTQFGFVNDTGLDLRWYSDRSLADIFHSHLPELLILQACEGGRLSDIFSFSNGAALLVKNHMPAVIAMQFPITNKAGWIFARRMYKDIIQGDPIDIAVQNSRRSLAMSSKESTEDHTTRDFVAPVLWVRSECEFLHPPDLLKNSSPIVQSNDIPASSNQILFDKDLKSNKSDWDEIFNEELKNQIRFFINYGEYSSTDTILAEIISFVLKSFSKCYSEKIAIHLAALIIDADLNNVYNTLLAIQADTYADDLENSKLQDLILEDIGIHTIQEFKVKLSQLLDGIEIQKGCSIVLQSTHVLNYCLDLFVETRQRDQIIRCLNEFSRYPRLTEKDIIQKYRNELGNIPSSTQVNRITNKINHMKQQEDSYDNDIIDYLLSLQTKYTQWKDSYVSLEGSKQDNKKIKLNPSFVDTEFQQIISDKSLYPYPKKTVPIPDVLQAMINIGRCILLGDPGAGKTTTLWKLAIDMVEHAIEDISAKKNPKVPIFVPLGGFLGFDDTFLALIERHSGLLSDQISTLLAQGRVSLLLDGLNEIPIATYTQRIHEISDFLEQSSNDVVITSRILDYQHELALTEIIVLPLNPLRIYNFCKTALQNYPNRAEELFWSIAGQKCKEFWIKFKEADGDWDAFWLSNNLPSYVTGIVWSSYGLWEEWLKYRSNLPGLMGLAQNPFMLTMLVQIFVRSGGYLPENKAALFETFVARLLEQQKKRSEGRGELWIGEPIIQKTLSSIAFIMQLEDLSGTTIEQRRFVELAERFLPEDISANHFIRLVSNANLIAYDNNSIRFVHQLLQEYFAAKELKKTIENNGTPDEFFKPDNWWEPMGWDEAFILLTGSDEDPNFILTWFYEANPILAARCIAESGSEKRITDITKRKVRDYLFKELHNRDLSKNVRSMVGQALNYIEDTRNGILDFDWKRDTIEISSGEFTIGAGVDAASIFVDTYRIARFPVTNAIYKQFVDDGGYSSEKWWIPEDSANWRKYVKGPAKYPFPFNLDNNSIVGVSWFEAMAFCAWMTNKLRSKLPPEWEIRLPTEIEWEKAARGLKNRIYPWSNDFDEKRLNATETIGHTMAVGTFEEGASSSGILEMSGNVWEWCVNAYWPYPYNPNDGRESINGGVERERIVRGGSWYDSKENAMTTARHGNDPNIRFDDWGFRICCGKRLQMNQFVLQEKN
jgi:formylglycine-generating enzyme required for sulfatase activity